MKKKVFIVFILILSFVFFFSLWAFWYEPSSLQLKEYKVYLKKWPKELNGFRIAILTDLHIGSPYNGISKLKEIVKISNKEKFDMILLPGDFVVQGVLGGEPISAKDIVNELIQLKSKYGNYYVMGNHDWWVGGNEVLDTFLQKELNVLENKSQIIHANDQQFYLVGIGDFTTQHHDLKKAFSQVLNPSLPVIIMTHNPDVFPKIELKNSLTIAGHTHGGQVNLPIVGRMIVPSKYGQKYAAGQIVEKDKTLFVSSGTGTSIMPVRFMVPPEISILKIYNKSIEN